MSYEGFEEHHNISGKRLVSISFLLIYIIIYIYYFICMLINSFFNSSCGIRRFRLENCDGITSKGLNEVASKLIVLLEDLEISVITSSYLR